MQELLQGGVQKLEQHPETKCVLCENAGVAARCRSLSSILKNCVLCADAGVAARWSAEA